MELYDWGFHRKCRHEPPYAGCMVGTFVVLGGVLLLMNGARALLESLKAEGVEVVFGYPGGAVLTLYDEVYKMRFPHIHTRHEQGAAHAADG